jgi:hypothetical protein
MEEFSEAAEARIDTSFEDEIEAMKAISQAFNKLDADARERVLSWIASRFGVRTLADRIPGRTPTNGHQPAVAVEPEVKSPGSERTFEFPAELFDAVKPKTDTEKALVLAYWFQVCQGSASFTSRQVNDELKHIGHGVGNITRALEGLTETKPALVIQLEKSGKTQQAQKKFKVTHEGVKRVQQLIAAGGGE